MVSANDTASSTACFSRRADTCGIGGGVRGEVRGVIDREMGGVKKDRSGA